MYCNDYDEMISYENEKKIAYPTKSKLTIDKFITNSNRYKKKKMKSDENYYIKTFITSYPISLISNN